jgi:hypothetical protein
VQQRGLDVASAQGLGTQVQVRPLWRWLRRSRHLFRRGRRFAAGSGDGRVFGVEQGECHPREVPGAGADQREGAGVPPGLGRLTGPRVKCCSGWVP